MARDRSWDDMTVDKIRKYLIICWICGMFGLVTSMLFTARMQFIGSGTTHAIGGDFYQIGDVFEFSDSQVAAARKIQTNGKTRWTFKNPLYEKKSCYLSFFVEGTEANEHTAAVYLQNKDKEYVQKFVIDIQKGWNSTFFFSEEVNQIRIILDTTVETGMAVTAVKMTERNPVSHKMLLPGVIIATTFYLFLYALYSMWKKIHGCYNWYEAFVRELQRIYIWLGRCAGRWTQHIGKRWIGIWRQIMWMALFWICLMGKANGSYFETKGHRNIVIVGAVLLICIGVLCSGEKIKFQKWNGVMAKSYFAFSVCMILADFMVYKKIGGEGVILLVIFPFVIFMWKNMERPRDFVSDMVVAVVAVLLIRVILCLIFGEIMTGVPSLFWSDLATDADRVRVVKEFFWSISPWGHNKDFSYFGEKQKIYSGALGVLWRYGVFALMAYVVMMVSFFSRLLKSVKEKWYVAILGSILFVLTVVRDFELVFGGVDWILFYLLIGYFMNEGLESGKRSRF